MSTLLAVIVVAEVVQAVGVLGVLWYWHNNLQVSKENLRLSQLSISYSEAHDLRAQEVHALEVAQRKALVAEITKSLASKEVK